MQFYELNQNETKILRTVQKLVWFAASRIFLRTVTKCDWLKTKCKCKTQMYALWTKKLLTCARYTFTFVLPALKHKCLLKDWSSYTEKLPTDKIVCESIIETNMSAIRLADSHCTTVSLNHDYWVWRKQWLSKYRNKSFAHTHTVSIETQT